MATSFSTSQTTLLAEFVQRVHGARLTMSQARYAEAYFKGGDLTASYVKNVRQKELVQFWIRDYEQHKRRE